MSRQIHIILSDWIDENKEPRIDMEICRWEIPIGKEEIQTLMQDTITSLNLHYLYPYTVIKHPVRYKHNEDWGEPPHMTLLIDYGLSDLIITAPIERWEATAIKLKMEEVGIQALSLSLKGEGNRTWYVNLKGKERIYPF